MNKVKKSYPQKNSNSFGTKAYNDNKQNFYTQT